MMRVQRAKYQMFVRARNFGLSNRDVFPESSVAGQTFIRLAELVAWIEEHITRRANAKANSSRVRDTTRGSAMRFMRVIAATGRRAVRKETGPHPFRMPMRRTPPELLGVARLFRAEAERRKARFLELGMAPTFLTDFDAVIKALEDALMVQQDSRGARAQARAGIETALAEGTDLVADLDVTVANVLENNPVLFAHWQGARRVDYPAKPDAARRRRASLQLLEPAKVAAVRE